MNEITVRMRNPHDFNDLVIRKNWDTKISTVIVKDQTDEEIEKELVEGLAPLYPPIDGITFERFEAELQSDNYLLKLEAYVTLKLTHVVRGHATGKETNNKVFFHFESDDPLTQTNLTVAKNMCAYAR